jgi:hypothetical protein
MPCSALVSVCASWDYDETNFGSRKHLDRVTDMSHQKYGTSDEGERCWTLRIKVKRDFSRHTISLSQQAYITSVVEHFGP